MNYYTGRKTNDKQAIELRDKCRELRRKGLKLREIGEALGIKTNRANYYVNYAK